MSESLLVVVTLLLLEGLFTLRVVGQLLVRERAPAWLPPMERWASGLLPYRLLLGIQAVTLLLMTAVAVGIAQGWPAIAERQPALGSLLVVVASVYALSMLVRYGLRMARRPDERWLGGTIPIAFHLVLAAWLMVLGAHLGS
jgi:hypothetical protein